MRTFFVTYLVGQVKTLTGIYNCNRIMTTQFKAIQFLYDDVHTVRQRTGQKFCVISADAYLFVSIPFFF